MLRSPQKFSKKTKDQLRKKFLSIRKKKYFEVSENRLNSLTTYIKKKYKVKKKIFVALNYSFANCKKKLFFSFYTLDK